MDMVTRVSSRWAYLRVCMKELQGASLTRRERAYLALGRDPDGFGFRLPTSLDPTIEKRG